MSKAGILLVHWSRDGRCCNISVLFVFFFCLYLVVSSFFLVNNYGFLSNLEVGTDSCLDGTENDIYVVISFQVSRESDIFHRVIPVKDFDVVPQG